MKISYFRHYLFAFLGIIFLFHGIIIGNNIIYAINTNFKKEISKEKVIQWEEYINELYKIELELFIFNEANTAILKIDDYNIEREHSSSVTEITKDFYFCAGYFIITIVEDKLVIDSSHICDMIDF